MVPEPERGGVDQIGGRAQPHLLFDTFAVGLHGFRAEIESRGDLPRGHTAADHVVHLQLTAVSPDPPTLDRPSIETTS